MLADAHRKEFLSRRQMLALSGVTGAAALAGCFGGGNEDPENVGNGNSPEGEIDQPDPGNYEEEMNEAIPGGAANPYNGEYIFNTYHQLWNAGDVQETCFEYLAVYNTADGEYLPRVAEDWEIGDDLVTEVTISQDYGWHDGSDITAEDFVTMIKMDGYMQMGIDEYVDPAEGVRATGDYTFEIEPREEYRDLEEELWLTQWAETMLFVSAEQYGQFIEAFEEAGSQDERENVQQDVIAFEPGWDQVLYSGPMYYAEANEEYADQLPNPEHPVAQDWDFYLRHGIFEEEEGVRAEEVDWLHNDPTLEDLPEIYDEPPVSFSGQSLAIIFGAEDEYIRDYPDVRKAIAYAVDMEHIVEVTRPGTPVDTYSTGIDVGYVENFVDSDVLDAMPNYAPQDTDRATELLEGVGFAREDDGWYTPEGELWGVNFPVGDWFETHSEMVYNNLAEFGIDVDWYVQEMPTWQSEVESDNAFDMTIHLNYGMARQYHAHADLYEELLGSARGIYRDTNRDLFGEDVEVPEVGTPDGDTVTLNLPDELDALASASADEESTEHATNLAWAHNQLLPAAVVFPWSEHYFVNAGEWDFDLESDDWLTSNRITHYLLENGLSPE